MAKAKFLLLTFPLFLAPARAQNCTLAFDGRVPSSYTPESFDESTSIYDDEYVHGSEQTWADILQLPDVTPSLFDAQNGTQAVEVTISDSSIFLPGGGTPQTGFRRSELVPGINTGSDATVQGSKIFHWSLRTDSERPLNYSHEYHLLWHETNDYSTSQFNLQTGTPFSVTKDPGVSNPRTLRLTGRQSQTPESLIWQTELTEDTWHNFALRVGWETNTFDLWYSNASNPLTQVVSSASNDNSGGGQFHLGVFKMPTGAESIDVVHEGYQESGIDEGIVWGGVFIEDGEGGCVSVEA